MIWIQNGIARAALDKTLPDLPEGTLLFLRRGADLKLRRGAPDTFVAGLSVPAALIDDLPRRHPHLSGQWFWKGDQDLPHTLRFDARQLAWLNRLVLTCEDQGGGALALEALVLSILAEAAHLSGPLPPDAPSWLQDACKDALTPEGLCAGVAGIVAKSGKTDAHVARVFRKHMDQSPRDWITEARLAMAARRLSGSDADLQEIAAEIGLPNLSHFHKMFKARYDQSPARFRKLARSSQR